MINYLALLGWNDGTDQDVYTREELINSFDLSRVTPSPAMFDMTKLKWINGQHLRAMPVEKFAGRSGIQGWTAVGRRLMLFTCST